jgi:hypothetical protein
MAGEQPDAAAEFQRRLEVARTLALQTVLGEMQAAGVAAAATAEEGQQEPALPAASRVPGQQQSRHLQVQTAAGKHHSRTQLLTIMAAGGQAGRQWGGMQQ